MNNITEIIDNTNNIPTNLLNEIFNIKKQLSLPYPLKDKYNNVIPAHLFQTWHSKTLPPLMYKAVLKLKKTNPRFNYRLYDDNDCREFIKTHYRPEVLEAYDKLIPGAYKADLWRYCILYKYGGIYLDIKYIPVNNFKLINLLEKEHFCLDADNIGIYNAIMVSKPNNPILLNAINQIVEHTKQKYYGEDVLEVTGPKLLSRYFSIKEKDGFELKHNIFFSSNHYRVITFNNYIVLRSYDGYIKECKKYQKIDHYSKLWSKRQIYH